MKLHLIGLIALWLGAGMASMKSADAELLHVGFDDVAIGELKPELLPKLFGELHWESLEGRASVVGRSDGNRALEAFYPAGAHGSKRSGASFTSKLQPSLEYFLSYQIRFSEGFPFNRGGKLPGLSSSGSKFTGGRRPPESGGWSARYMWRRNGELELYLYHPKMEGPSGDRYGFDFRCEPATWYTFTQRVKVNEPGKSNGLIQVWIDGKRYLNLDGLFLRGEDVGLIDSFLFSTFFGGSTKEWAPPSDCTIQFDEFILSTSAPPAIRGKI